MEGFWGGHEEGLLVSLKEVLAADSDGAHLQVVENGLLGTNP